MDGELKSKSVKGMTWVGIDSLSTKVIRFAIGIVMARLLVPSDYGIVGMLAIFIAISSMFVDSGFGAALIQKKDRTEVDYSTVFFFNLAMACGCYAILFVAAPLIAAFYKMPILTDICRVVALGLPLGALCTIHRSRLTIALDFRTQTLVSLVSLVSSGALGIFLAFAGYGVWSLVWQGLASSAVSIVLLWTISRWRPVLAFSADSFRRFFSYGWKHLCASLVNTVYANVYTLVIGKAFGAADIGYFTRAEGYASLPSNTITDMVVRVNFPIMSQLQDDRTALVAAYRKMLRTPMFVLVPISFGIASIAEPLVSVMIGEKWLPCVPFLQVLCLGVVFNPLSLVNLNLLYVKGRTDCVLKLELIKKPIAFAIVLGMIPLGVFWMCVGKAVYDLIAFAFNCHYTKKILDYGFWAQLKDVLPLFAYGIVMAAAVLFSVSFCGNVWTQLGVGMAVGAVVYIGIAAAARDESLRELRRIAVGTLTAKHTENA